MNLDEDEQQAVREMLNTMDDATVNLMALDRKYDKQWYAEQLCHLRRMDEYFKEVGRVMEIADRHDVQRAIDEKRTELTKIMDVYEKAIKDLEEDSEAMGKGRESVRY